MNQNRLLPLIHPSLIILVLTITTGLTLVAITSLPLAQTMYIETGYFFMLGLAGIYVFVLLSAWRDIRIHANQFWAQTWHGALFAIFLSSLIFISVPMHHRMLYDDLHLLAVAKEMTFEQKAVRKEEIWNKNPDFVPTSMIEKRPLLFPFFISLLNSLSGYRLSNVFVLNYLSLCGFLFGLYCFLRRYLTKTWSAAALILVVAQPIVPLCATSGGFEICNLALIAFSFLALRYFLDAPSTTRLQLLIFQLLLLSHIQYAAVLFLIFILCIISLRGYIKKSFLLEPSLISIAPLFLLPIIWQRIIMPQLPDPDYPAGMAKNAFSLKYLAHNTVILPHYFFNLLGGNGGLAGAINIAGTIAILALIVYLFWNQKSLSKEFLTLIISLLAPLGLILFFVLLYYNGMDSHPMIGRLYLPFVILLSVSPIVIARHLLPEHHAHGPIALLLSSALFLFYFPVAASSPISPQGRYVRELKSTRELNVICDFWEKNPLKNSLIIYRAGRHFSPFLNDAINFRTAKKWKTKLLEQFQQHVYDEMYVIQRVFYKTEAPFKEDILDEELPLVTLAEKKIAHDYYLRFSVIK